MHYMCPDQGQMMFTACDPGKMVCTTSVIVLVSSHVILMSWFRLADMYYSSPTWGLATCTTTVLNRERWLACTASGLASNRHSLWSALPLTSATACDALTPSCLRITEIPYTCTYVVQVACSAFTLADADAGDLTLTSLVSNQVGWHVLLVSSLRIDKVKLACICSELQCQHYSTCADLM